MALRFPVKTIKISDLHLIYQKGKRLFPECDLVQVPVKRGFIKKVNKKIKEKNYVK